MKNFVEFHIVHPMAPSCLNRNEFGMCKTINVGGIDRTYISSQCWKHTVRKNFQAKFPTAIRCTIQDVSDMIIKCFEQLGVDSKSKAAVNICKEIIKLFGSEKDNKTLIFVSQEEIFYLVKFCLENDYKQVDLKEIAKKAIIEDDLALFGRMLASNTENRIDGAVDFAHSYSINKHQNTEDYFGGWKDSFLSGETTAAVHLGNRDCCSSVFYRYFAIDLNKFKENKNNRINKQSLAEFIKMILLSTPDAMQHSMASRTLPSYILMNYYEECYFPTQIVFEKTIDGENEYGESISEQAKNYIKKEMDNAMEKFGASKPTCIIENNVNEIVKFIANLDF